MKEDEKKRLAIVDFLNAVSADLALPEKYRLQAAALTFDFTDPKANPFAPPIQLRIEGDKVVGRANFGLTFEGAVGTVHGGFVAATFDQVLYLAQSVTQIPAVTGTLTIRYRSPTPLLTELLLQGKVDHVEGRKIFAGATISANGIVTAEAEGLFIATK
jgi:acyl-coenzyme A thioesterase PaaI-like protein